MDFDARVRAAVYDSLTRLAEMPSSADVAHTLGVDDAQVRAAFLRLHERHLLVPEPGDPSRLRMAAPFSGIRTGFRVTVGTRTYDANCVWDAFGVAAALHADAVIDSEDGFTREPMRLGVRGGAPFGEPCVVHFAVPAARWWDDVIHT